MPRLKKLELQGFKSFADPSDFLFPTGITAVVGPNGSGKSNVADSIRWVLGEQRMTAIRGRTGEDMIFAGSTSRSRSGMARATITFDNSDRWVPVDFAEVTVERRTYRDGTSDYLLRSIVTAHSINSYTYFLRLGLSHKLLPFLSGRVT